MIKSDEFDARMRAALRRHIERTSSISQAARELGISKSALHKFLSGESDTGHRRAYRWAEKLGLTPTGWIRRSGALPELSSYADTLRSRLSPRPAEDSLLQECIGVLAKMPLRPPSQLSLPSIAVAVEDVHLSDPRAAEVLAIRCLRNKLRQLRQAQRERLDIGSEDLVELFALIGSYGLCRYSKTAPRAWAWCIAFALDYFQPAGNSPPLTWLLIDGSMVLRRLFKTDLALGWAQAAVGASLLQETSRLHPRALLALASVCFARGDYARAAKIDELVLESPAANPYQPLAAYSASVALARVDASEAAEILSRFRRELDLLPPHRQLQRHWTEARVLGERGATEEAFAAYVAAIKAGSENSDTRDLFLIFDEARILVGLDDLRLKPIAEELQQHLIRMSFEFPDEWYAAERYLEFFRKRKESQLREQIGIISAQSAKAE